MNLKKSSEESRINNYSKLYKHQSYSNSMVMTEDNRNSQDVHQEAYHIARDFFPDQSYGVKDNGRLTTIIHDEHPEFYIRGSVIELEDKKDLTNNDDAERLLATCKHLKLNVSMRYLHN